jgi:SAM-dependent methyltransferase
VANAEQVDYWNSPERRHWIDEAARYDEMLAGFSERMLDGAAIERSERVLDVGCGCGTTTLHAARTAADGEALGIDISMPMITYARERARGEGLENVRFQVADAQTHSLDAGFDVVISRLGVMFFDDPTAAFTNLHRATRAGGRLAFVCWGDVLLNEWMTVPVAAAMQHVPMPALAGPGEPGPYGLADEERVRTILGDAGWSAVRLEAVQMPMLVGGSGAVDDALDFIRHTGIGRMLLSDTEPEAAARATDAVREALASHHNGRGVELGGAAWLVTAAA